ncbi:YdeI/OmpD-associated family protein [Blastomonas aquatica]|uniref:YdeI/OmpD-associated family protein n=1 Tax=Blastomonas aquatica TaxID=1510276 RepID=UPI00362017C4
MNRGTHRRLTDVPDVLQAALDRDADAAAAWGCLTPGRKRMAVQHVLSAKSAPTRQRRLEEALDAVIRFGGDLNARRKATRGVRRSISRIGIPSQNGRRRLLCWAFARRVQS